MKEKDVKIDLNDQQMMIYAEKQDGSISPIHTGSLMVNKYIDEFREMTEKLLTALNEKLKKGEISPVYYFMTMEELSVADLASRAGISKSSVKKHLDLKGFKKASVEDLKRYADAFNVPVANFFQVIRTIEDKKWYTGYHESNEKSEAVLISQVKTDNPLIVETKIVQEQK
jgi:transcriptional regulator with XRE-family HTH domain